MEYIDYAERFKSMSDSKLTEVERALARERRHCRGNFPQLRRAGKQGRWRPARRKKAETMDYAEKTDDRQNRVEKSYNLHLLDALDCDLNTGMPILERAEVAPPETLVAFNTHAHVTRESAGAHFWLDDYRFENTWRDPLRYVPMLDKFHCVIEPDFSVYVNMPEPMQRWNVFRGRALNRIWSDAGLCVVPKLTWGFEDSYRFCFDGLPRGGTVALSTVGLAKSKELVEFFHNGASAAVRAVQPEIILAHGKQLDFDSGKADVIWYPPETQQRFSEMRAARKAAKEN